MDQRGPPEAAAPAGRDGDVERLQAEGRRLSTEEERLRAARARGVVDGDAQARWSQQLTAHQEALRRFRTGR